MVILNCHVDERQSINLESSFLKSQTNPASNDGFEVGICGYGFHVYRISHPRIDIVGNDKAAGTD